MTMGLTSALNQEIFHTATHQTVIQVPNKTQFNMTHLHLKMNCSHRMCSMIKIILLFDYLKRYFLYIAPRAFCKYNLKIYQHTYLVKNMHL